MNYSMLKHLIFAVFVAGVGLTKSWAQTTTTQAGNKGGSITTSSLKDLRKRLREKIELSYYGIFSGSELNGHWGKSVDIDNQETQLYMFHIIRSGYRITPNTSAGLITRFSQDFTMRRGEEVIQNHNYELLNPRFYARQRNMIDNKAINLMGEVFAELPTTEINKQNKMTTTVGSTQFITFNQPIKKLSLSLFMAQQFRIYRIQKDLNKTIFAFYPFINYTFNETLGLQIYAQITRTQRQQMPIHDTRAARDDYFRFGPTVNPFDWLQIFLAMQMFLARPQLNTSTLAFELSASI